jgi:spoIIIJ-associated protein
MSEQRVEVESSGETVGEARWGALHELERRYPSLDRAEVEFVVLSEGERGLLGVGYQPARVLASVTLDPDLASKPATSTVSADDTPAAAAVRELVERVVRGLGIDGSIELREREGVVTATVHGSDLGLLIGKHGQTIDAIQYLANAIVHRGKPDDRKAIVVDAAGYRERRKASLDALALRSAERAASSGERVELEPMTAVERKVVHLRLKNYPGVETTSEGTEPNRFVVISPA